MGRPTELGKVQPGFFGDVILVNGDPLEDISVLSNHEKIDVVVIVSRLRLILVLWLADLLGRMVAFISFPGRMGRCSPSVFIEADAKGAGC